MIKTLTCTDCRVKFTYDHRKGPTRQRCDSCTETRRLAHVRQRTAAYRERWPDRSREQWNKHNRKRLKDPEYVKRKADENMLRTYGITRIEYDQRVVAQGGVCAICGGPPVGPGKRLHIDHCHNSLMVRGLICSPCNTAIGLLANDPVRAEAVAAYLRR